MTKELFLEKVFNLFPKGNPTNAFNEFHYAVAIRKTFSGESISSEFLTEKWSQYIKSCNDKNTDEKYIKSLESWLKAEDYNTVYRVSPLRKTSIRRTKK